METTNRRGTNRPNWRRWTLHSLLLALLAAAAHAELLTQDTFGGAAGAPPDVAQLT